MNDELPTGEAKAHMLPPEDQAAMRAERMRVQLEGLETFAKTINGILDDLTKDSHAPVDKSAVQDVHAEAYGRNFLEAQIVQGATDRVSERVKELATKLQLQIEAMHLTIKMSVNKAAEADQDNRDALGKILGQYQAQFPSAPGTPTAGQPTTTAPPPTSPRVKMD
ncbi:hypothetical protein [Yinghuangia seranimata]|uniref:hypothetical protein n=1 Tax=Yinghuangia seranimata TaxID=408067 RepID=UPI00248CBA55|nr:hypothetical protein [Yinghuangia seranimata]MDI2132471.1 hypothetical protein [Yinghuangia seranimata]